MAEIIPSINVRTIGEMRERIARVEPYVSWCHLDVTDGVFSVHETWRDPRDLEGLQIKVRAEVHLMIERPEDHIERWCAGPVKRVIVHIEAMQNPTLLIEKCRARGIEVGFSVNSGTSWEKLAPWFGKVDLLQILAVPPGPSGQMMGEETHGKIRHIRDQCGACIIEVDGGVNEKTAPEAIRSGANILVAGSAIFGADNIEKAIKLLRVK